MGDALSHVLMHELTHSFLRQRTLGRCPTWLQEGLAQWMEGRRSTMYAPALVVAYKQGNYVPLSKLEGSWNHFPARTAEFAYAWALATVEAIMAEAGMYGMERFFVHFTNEATAETALREALQKTFAEYRERPSKFEQQCY